MYVCAHPCVPGMAGQWGAGSSQQPHLGQPYPHLLEKSLGLGPGKEAPREMPHSEPLISIQEQVREGHRASNRKARDTLMARSWEPLSSCNRMFWKLRDAMMGRGCWPRGVVS